MTNFHFEPLPPEDKAKMLELRDFCEQHSCELYFIGMTGYEINYVTTLSRELHLRALRLANQPATLAPSTPVDAPQSTPPESKLNAKQ